MEWTNEQVMQFLEGYQAEPCIWDPQHPDHRNRNRVAAVAWQRLHEALNLNCIINGLKKKKNSLMASFRMLLNKKKKCVKSGMGTDELFKRIWFAYEAMEKFLAPVYHCTFTISTEINSIVRDTHSSTAQLQSNNNGNSNHDDNSTEDCEELLPAENRPATKPAQVITKSPKIVKTNPLLQAQNNLKNNQSTSEKRMEEAFHILKDTAQPRREREKEDCDLSSIGCAGTRRSNGTDRHYVAQEKETKAITTERSNFHPATHLYYTNRLQTLQNILNIFGKCS